VLCFGFIIASKTKDTGYLKISHVVTKDGNGSNPIVHGEFDLQ
jgi:hypothetical protein